LTPAGNYSAGYNAVIDGTRPGPNGAQICSVYLENMAAAAGSPAKGMLSGGRPLASVCPPPQYGMCMNGAATAPGDEAMMEFARVWLDQDTIWRPRLDSNQRPRPLSRACSVP